MEATVDFSKGGIALVMVGNTGFVQEFAADPRVTFIKCNDIQGSELENLVPANTKAVIITDGIPQYHYQWIMSFVRRKNLVYLVRKSNQAIYQTLKEFFPANGNGKATPDEAKEAFVKGKLNPLIEHIDWSKSNAENAKILERKANDLGIKTTFGSLAQFVANKRREKGQGTVPKSARSKLDLSVEFFDKMMADATAVREFLIATVEENRILKDKLHRLEKAFNG